FLLFSSRRRHTRLQGDWSSDVCSSDLTLFALAAGVAESPEVRDAVDDRAVLVRQDADGDIQPVGERLDLAGLAVGAEVGEHLERSEERRVGKECIDAWWLSNHQKVNMM